MSVIATKLPASSLLHVYVAQGDFLDCFACKSSLNVDEAAKVGLKFPFWAGALLALRNMLVAPLGLATTAPKGEAIGHFLIDQRNETEVILGYDDSHLDFRISIMRHEDFAYGATWVHTKNWLGKAYLATIMPFHVLIMRNAMRQVAMHSAKSLGGLKA